MTCSTRTSLRETGPEHRSSKKMNIRNQKNARPGLIMSRQLRQGHPSPPHRKMVWRDIDPRPTIRGTRRYEKQQRSLSVSASASRRTQTSGVDRCAQRAASPPARSKHHQPDRRHATRLHTGEHVAFRPTSDTPTNRTSTEGRECVGELADTAQDWERRERGRKRERPQR
ncbi:hypothetical protein B0H12DRAFT_1077041 [Mycena haematopus]|nr:hypothetical protein B0H12DRAFT_1077041 [Mycena haematopus]